MHHVFTRESGDGVIFAQEDGLLRADLFAHAAENAADHVDIEFFRVFFDFGETIGGRNFAWHHFDGARRTDEFAQLAGNAAHPAVRVTHERGRAAIMLRQAAVPFFLGILHRYFRSAQNHVFEMLDRNSHATDDRRQIDSLAPVELRACNGDSHKRKLN